MKLDWLTADHNDVPGWHGLRREQARLSRFQLRNSRSPDINIHISHLTFPSLILLSLFTPPLDIPGTLITFYSAPLVPRFAMPATIQKTPHKRLLSDATNTRANHQASPRSAKKLKFDHSSTQNGRKIIQVGANGSFNSSQPAKSRFEEEVLEKMSQDLTNLKQTNTEKDQQWSRPPLTEDWEEGTQNLCFQQIEAEEGQLSGGKTTVKLFGVTQVSYPVPETTTQLSRKFNRLATPSSST